MKALCKDPKKIKVIQQTLFALKKIGDELKLEIDPNQFVMRSLNSSNSALPVVRFNSSFFSNYTYDHDSAQILCQLSISYLLPAFKNVQNAASLVFAVDPNQLKFTLCLDDRSGISHSWELFLQDTVLLTALYDLESATVSVKCRGDIFKGVSTAFKGSENVFLEVSKDSGPPQMTLSSSGSNNSVSSSLTIRKGDNCDCQFNDESNKIGLRLSLADFLVAIKLGSIFSQKLEMFLLTPGHPIIIKTSMTTQVMFEIALATGVEEWNEDSTSQATGNGAQSFTDAQTTAQTLTPSATSPASPWRQNQSVASQQSATPALSEEYQQGMRDSQILAMGLFEASPDYPYRRKITGQYAENSQPQSSDSESDV